MKGLVIYYTLEGNTQFIADTLAKEMDFDVLQLKPIKDVPKKGFSKYVWGGKQVLFNQKPELEPFNKDFEQYDVIIMGSPVWASSYVPAYNTFFSENSIQNKKIALFCCYAGNEGKIFEAFKSKLSGNEILGQIGFKDPLKYNTQQNMDVAKKWIHKCI